MFANGLPVKYLVGEALGYAWGPMWRLFPATSVISEIVGR